MNMEREMAYLGLMVLLSPKLDGWWYVVLLALTLCAIVLLEVRLYLERKIKRLEKSDG